MTAAESLAEGTVGPVAFGSLLDLARLQVGGASAETCDVCNTINHQHAFVCKCCAHKLPAFYASRDRGREDTAGSALPRREQRVRDRQTWAPLVASFSFFFHSLLVATRTHLALVNGMAAKDTSR